MYTRPLSTCTTRHQYQEEPRYNYLPQYWISTIPVRISWIWQANTHHFDLVMVTSAFNQYCWACHVLYTLDQILGYSEAGHNHQLSWGLINHALHNIQAFYINTHTKFNNDGCKSFHVILEEWQHLALSSACMDRWWNTTWLYMYIIWLKIS